MARKKILKDYTIKITHPEFGEYYLNYIRNNYGYSSTIDVSYLFTKNLNKVKTWKTTKSIESEIKFMQERLVKNRGEILLIFGSDVDDELKTRMVVSCKRYYFKITSFVDKIKINAAKNNISLLDSTLISDSELITEGIKNGDHIIDKTFVKKIKQLQSDISNYKEDYLYLEKNKDVDVTVDIADASYGFRLLKLKNLRKVKDDVEELEDSE